MLLTVDRYGKDNDYGMLKHEFGMMMADPEPEQIFEEYEPEKYDCIAVDDEYVQAVAEKLARVSVYWHGLDRPESGLAYHGITLIPPESMTSLAGNGLMNSRWMSRLDTSSRTMMSRALLRTPPSSTNLSGRCFLANSDRRS